MTEILQTLKNPVIIIGICSIPLILLLLLRRTKRLNIGPLKTWRPNWYDRSAMSVVFLLLGILVLLCLISNFALRKQNTDGDAESGLYTLVNPWKLAPTHDWQEVTLEAVEKDSLPRNPIILKASDIGAEVIPLPDYSNHEQMQFCFTGVVYFREVKKCQSSDKICEVSPYPKKMTPTDDFNKMVNKDAQAVQFYREVKDAKCLTLGGGKIKYRKYVDVRR